MIIVTGATGLLGRVPAGGIGVSVRDPEKAADLAERGVRVRRGDFTEPSTLPHAFEGASTVLVVSSNSSGTSAVAQHRSAIEAAVTAGAGRVVYTAHMGSNPASPFPPMPGHAATEELLRDSGVAFTSLRNGFYTSTVPMLLGDAAETGELRLPEDGPVAWTAHADLAEAAAVALTSDDLDGLTPALTAAEAPDMAGVAAIASELTGRPIRRITVPDAEYRAALLARGLPESAADMLVGLFAASRDGDFGPADPTLANLLGRPPLSVRDVLRTALVTAPV
ncbi:MAG: NAD(P)H-binding protein [Pseudonocardia sediminis]